MSGDDHTTIMGSQRSGPQRWVGGPTEHELPDVDGPPWVVWLGNTWPGSASPGRRGPPRISPLVGRASPHPPRWACWLGIIGTTALTVWAVHGWLV